MTSFETILYEPKGHENPFTKKLMLGIGIVMLALFAFRKDYESGALGIGAIILATRPFKDKRKISVKDGRLHYRLGWMSEKEFRIEDVEKLRFEFTSKNDQYGSVSVERYYCFELNSGDKVFLPNVLTAENESILLDIFKEKMDKNSKTSN